MSIKEDLGSACREDRMTISKEERAELRELVANVTLPFPWEAEEATVLSGERDFIAECDEDDEECSEITTLIAAAATALPKTLDALDAADERIAELEAAAQSAIFALQPTWAQDPASLPATLGRAIAAHQESLQALAKGCDYVASQTDGYDRIVAEPMIALGLLAVVGTDEDGDPTYRRIQPAAPIPALPEGGAK